MKVVEMLLMVGLGVPIVVLSCAFVLCAGYMQMKENRCQQGK